MDWGTIGTFLAGFGSGYAVKLAINVRSDRKKSQIGGSGSEGGVTQHGNRAGGHIVGGDFAGRDINHKPPKGGSK